MTENNVKLYEVTRLKMPLDCCLTKTRKPNIKCQVEVPYKYMPWYNDLIENYRLVH